MHHQHQQLLRWLLCMVAMCCQVCVPLLVLGQHVHMCCPQLRTWLDKGKREERERRGNTLCSRSIAGEFDIISCRTHTFNSLQILIRPLWLRPLLSLQVCIVAIAVKSCSLQCCSKTQGLLSATIACERVQWASGRHQACCLNNGQNNLQLTRLLSNCDAKSSPSCLLRKQHYPALTGTRSKVNVLSVDVDCRRARGRMELPVPTPGKPGSSECWKAKLY